MWCLKLSVLKNNLFTSYGENRRTLRAAWLGLLSGIVICLCSLPMQSSADSSDDVVENPRVSTKSLRDARSLLRLTDMQTQFQAMAEQQTLAIIRTYASIVSMSAEIDLPMSLKNTIAECYDRVYSWDLFQEGIEQILAETLTSTELRLLIDFFSNRSVSPTEIEAFREVIKKAELIRQLSAEYIFANADSCVDHDAEIILAYVNNFKAQESAQILSE